MSEPVRLAVIGGSGLYQMDGLRDVEEVRVKTPFGDPSDAIITGTLEGERVAFLPRHGRGHRISPTNLPVRANIYALKSLGVERIIAVSACGSLREEMAPRHIVIPDQVFDRTHLRPLTFFDQGLVVHISFAEPFCPDLSQRLYEAVLTTSTPVHKGGNFVVVEGPRFSTKAESHAFRQWGMDIIGMTTVPEAQLAREAEICYAAMAHVTDYDVWHESEEPVTVEAVIRNLLANTAAAQQAIRSVVPNIPVARDCVCATALADAIITQRDAIPPETRERYNLLVGKYLV